MLMEVSTFQRLSGALPRRCEHTDEWACPCPCTRGKSGNVGVGTARVCTVTFSNDQTYRCIILCFCPLTVQPNGKNYRNFREISRLECVRVVSLDHDATLSQRCVLPSISSGR
jgi:hypothetical protein